MHEWQSLSHVKWECKYHVVIVPKYRRKRLYGRLRNQIGSILKDIRSFYDRTEALKIWGNHDRAVVSGRVVVDVLRRRQRG